MTPLHPLHKKPPGPALRRTDADRERLAFVTAADVMAARDLWHETAPAGWQGLIDAKGEPPEA